MLGIIWDWEIIKQYRLTWYFAVTGLVISVVWWYWTMIVLRLLIESRQEETVIIHELVKEIREIKKDIQER